MKRWHTTLPNPAQQNQLATALDIHPVTAQILINRGIAGADIAAAFLGPRFHHLHDPFLLPDMERAVERIVTAIQRQERICLFGDYDTDGVTGTALGVHFFQAIGAPVAFDIPHRVRDGYGLSINALERLWASGAPPQLIITIDNGTAAHAAIEWAKARGVDVVVTDHHAVPTMLPPAVAIVNPKRTDTAMQYPFHGLCGVGVFFKVCMALRHRLRAIGYFAHRPEPNMAQWLDLVMVGTIADVVPLLDENRIFCHYGLKAMAQSRNIGLNALCQAANVVPTQCTTRTVAFQLAPRINAAGRLSDAGMAVELLTTECVERAQELAAMLHGLNAERQAMEEKMQNMLSAELATQPSDRCSIVAASPEWAPGVVGIVASRLAAIHRKPTVLISTQGEWGLGSARGIGEFPLLEALTACAEHLHRFGGHTKAAGVTIAPGNIPQFREAFEAAVRARLLPEHRQNTVVIDVELAPHDINAQLVTEIERLGPFGEGNPEPVLCLRNLGVKQRRIVGGRHLKMTVHGGMMTFDAIGFSMSEHPHGTAAQIDVAFTPEHNEWNGVRSIQLKLKDLREIEGNNSVT